MSLQDEAAGRRPPGEASPDPLARRIRTLRRAKGITLRELAERAAVTESFLSQMERGITSPSDRKSTRLNSSHT